MAEVSFDRLHTRKEALELSATNTGCVYFPTDSQCIILGGKEYTSSLKAQVISLTDYNNLTEYDDNTLYLVKADKQDITS